MIHLRSSLRWPLAPLASDETSAEASGRLGTSEGNLQIIQELGASRAISTDFWADGDAQEQQVPCSKPEACVEGIASSTSVMSGLGD